MTTLPLLALALATAAPTLVAAAAAAHSDECTTPMDCALSGSCVAGRCVCDSGWKSPPGGGTPCSVFDLLPADPAAEGYHNTSWPSWGGHPVQWSSGPGADSKWHLFTPQFANGCTVDQWIHNSFIVHAVGDSPTGPWHHHDVAIPIWAHGSQAVQEPRTRRWLLYFVGGWHYPPTQWASCEPGDANISWGGPVEPAAGPGLGPVGDCGPKGNAGCGIRVAESSTPFGPWTIHEVEFEAAREGYLAKELTCARSDPAPYILPNGTVMLAFGSGGCVGGLETVGVARAEQWNATYKFTSATAIAQAVNFATLTPSGTATAAADDEDDDDDELGLNPSRAARQQEEQGQEQEQSIDCPTGNLAEDADIWFDGKRGWHIIAHSLCAWYIPGGPVPGPGSWPDNYGLHAYSMDGSNWRVALGPPASNASASGLPILPWSKHVDWSNGSTTFIGRMERPQVVLDSSGTRPIYLTTAVCVGGQSVGGQACTDRHGVRHKSWDLYRPINHHGQ